MKLKEIFDLVLVESGQFLLGSDIELDEGKFKLFMQSCVNFYNKHTSHIKNMNVDIQQTGNGYSYTFPDEDAPDIIYSANVQTWNNQLTAQFYKQNRVDNDYYLDKSPQPVRYEKPTLYSSYMGIHDVKAGYNHKITYTESNGLKEYKIDTIDFNSGEHADFLEYVTGRFMSILGTSRSAFTMADLPIENNGQDLVSEGKDKTERAERNITDKAWVDSWG